MKDNYLESIKSEIINGNAKVSENNEDFSVIFTAA